MSDSVVSLRCEPILQHGEERWIDAAAEMLESLAGVPELAR